MTRSMGSIGNAPMASEWLNCCSRAPTFRLGSGQYEIYVRPFPDVENGKWQVSSAGGEEPIWSRDGLTLFFAGPEDWMQTSVESTEAAFAFQTPERVLDRGAYVWLVVPRRYDVSLDGQRFLVQKNATGGTGGAAPRSSSLPTGPRN